MSHTERETKKGNEGIKLFMALCRSSYICCCWTCNSSSTEKSSYSLKFLGYWIMRVEGKVLGSPSLRNSCWASPACPTHTFGTVHTCHRQTLLLRAAGDSRPPCAFPRARAPSAGGTCADSTTPSRARRRPSTPSRRWTRAHTSRPPGAACPSGRSWGWSWSSSGGGRRSIRCLSASSRRRALSRLRRGEKSGNNRKRLTARVNDGTQRDVCYLRGCCSLSNGRGECVVIAPASARAPRASRPPHL